MKLATLAAFCSVLFLWFPVGLLAQGYVEVWSDDFNTPGLPDCNQWDYEVGKVRNNELQYYTRQRLENARVEDGVLIIEAHKESYEDANYTSASLISRNAGDWRYGKIEISAKVPTGNGTWPALWMMPTYSLYGGWPRSGEIDIMEYIGVEPQNLYYNAHFEGDDGSGHQSSGSGPVRQFRDPFSRVRVGPKLLTFQLLHWRNYSILRSVFSFYCPPLEQRSILVFLEFFETFHCVIGLVLTANPNPHSILRNLNDEVHLFIYRTINV